MDEGTERDIIAPKNEMFAIHLDERRGSSVNAAPDQYLGNIKYLSELGMPFIN